MKIFFSLLIFCAASSHGWADTQTQLADQAEQQLRAGNRSGAVALLEKAAAESGTPSGEDRIGFLFAVAGNETDAATHFLKAIQTNTKFAAAHYHLGVLLWLSKDRENGLKELQSAAQLEPASFDYRYRLGSAYVDLGANEKAVLELKAAVSANAAKAEAWQELGVAEQRVNDPAAAVAALSKAVELAPNNDEMRNRYAELLIATRQPQRAIEEAQTVATHDGKNVTAFLNIGHAYLKMGEYAKAGQAYQDALAVDSGNVAAHYDLGIALKMQDEIDAAQKEFKRSIELDPSLAESHYTLGITDWQLGDFAGTVAEMKAALAIRPDYAEAHYMLGIALKQSGELDAALAELKESIRLDPSTPGPYNTIGQILRIKGDKKGSEEAFAAGAKLKRDKDSELSNALEQGMRGGMAPAPMENLKSTPGPR